MFVRKYKYFLLLIFSIGCVGTDYIDDPIVPERIVMSIETVSLLVGEETTLSATYFNKYGIQENVPLVWNNNAPTVVEVSMGKIKALTVGSAIVTASYNNFVGPQIPVTVVSTNKVVANVIIAQPASTQLKVGEIIQLEYHTTSSKGEPIINKQVGWFSENSSILTVSITGLAEAVGQGTVDVHAKYFASSPDEIDTKSNIITFIIEGLLNKRMGTFIKAGGYDSSGSVTLELKGDNLELTLLDDFKTSFALGTFIYLSNSTNGGLVRSGGHEVSQITTNGRQSFIITGVDIAKYKYVISLCKPATVTFGYAELK